MNNHRPPDPNEISVDPGTLLMLVVVGLLVPLLLVGLFSH